MFPHDATLVVWVQVDLIAFDHAIDCIDGPFFDVRQFVEHDEYSIVNDLMFSRCEIKMYYIIKMLNGSIKTKNVIIQGDGNVEDVTIGIQDDGIVMRTGDGVLMAMRSATGGGGDVRFPVDVGFDGNVVIRNGGEEGNVEVEGDACIQLGDTVLTESQLKRLIALVSF
jgi:hypothetical protein